MACWQERQKPEGDLFTRLDFDGPAYQSPDRAATEGMVVRMSRAGVAALVVTPMFRSVQWEGGARAGFGSPIRPGIPLGWDVATHPR